MTMIDHQKILKHYEQGYLCQSIKWSASRRTEYSCDAILSKDKIQKELSDTAQLEDGLGCSARGWRPSLTVWDIPEKAGALLWSSKSCDAYINLRIKYAKEVIGLDVLFRRIILEDFFPIFSINIIKYICCHHSGKFLIFKPSAKLRK